MCNLASRRDQTGKDVQRVPVIKDEDRNIPTNESVLRRWKEKFEELINEENEGERRVEEVEYVEQEV